MHADYDVIVVGGGPAGAAAAIQMGERDPGVAARTLVIDRAVFPREKLCGGGVVREADRFLSFLGVHIDVPSVPIHNVRFELPEGTVVRRIRDAFRVVRRDEFDAALLREAGRRGVSIAEGQRVTGVYREADAVRVVTDHGEGRARIVIGADGAGSLVRRTLVDGRKMRRFVALDILTGGVTSNDSGEPGNTAVFDFRPAAEGLHGYAWHFPCLRRGQPMVNRGIGGAVDPRSGSLRTRFAAHLRERGVRWHASDLQGATAPLYDPRLPQSSERVLLAGDAVGIDPWFGEGISVAIGTGMLAAHAAVEALASGDFRFAEHHRRIRDSAVGARLRGNRLAARAFYRAARCGGALNRWLADRGGAV